MTTPLGPAMHIKTAFLADDGAVEGPDGTVMRRCPGCGTGIASYTEARPVSTIGCTRGCTAEKILDALERSVERGASR